MRSRWAGVLIAVGIIMGAAFVAVRGDDETRLIRAVRDGDARLVASLLEERADLARSEEPHKAGATPALYLALSTGHKEIVRLLVSHGATPDKYPRALLLARNPEIARFLIEHGADVDRQGEYGRTPLYSFAAIDNVAMTEFLLDRGAGANVKSQGGLTPLHGAAQEGCLNTARSLVARGADVNARSAQNKTPLDLAVRPLWDEDARGMQPDRIRTCKAVASYLVSCGSPCTVFDLAWIGDLERLTNRFAADPSLVNALADGESLLFAAVRGGNADVVRYLLEHGAPVDIGGHLQQTPLQVAGYIGHGEVVEILLNHGADANSRGPWGETALHWAAVRGNTNVVALLLKRGADPNVQTSGHTVDLNVRANDADPVEREISWFQTRERQRRARGRLQVAYPARLAFTTGDTPLHAAAYWNRPKIVELLLAHGADVGRANRWGDTALHLGIVCGYADVAERLLNAGADPDARTQSGLTAVKLAREIKDEELIKLLRGRKPR